MNFINQIGLSDFKLSSHNLKNFSSTNSSITFNLTLFDLPFNKFGSIYILCNNSNIESKKTKCEPQNDLYICNCDQLNASNTNYSISLINQKDNFDMVEKSIGFFYTS